MVFASARLRGHLWRNTAASSLALERHQKSAIVSLYNFKKYQTLTFTNFVGMFVKKGSLYRKHSLTQSQSVHFTPTVDRTFGFAFCKRLRSHCSTGQEQAFTWIIWLFGCSFVCSMSPCRKLPNTQENGC